jgi:hypothetical protein
VSDQCDEYCKDPCDDFKSKIDKKIQNGISKLWPQKEKSSPWTDDQKSLVENALSQIPDALLANFDWNIFRLQKSIYFPNPASSDNESSPTIVLYDTAFSGKYNLPRVISHELAHIYYRNL